MNEKEEKALSAFQEARQSLESHGRLSAGAGEIFTASAFPWCAFSSSKLVDQTFPQNLAISYVNESLDLAALTTLHQFLAQAFPGHAGSAPLRSSMSEDASPWALHQQLRDSYLSLAREQFAQGGHVDSHVQVALGTLYYMMEEYGEARDCWVAALAERPDVRSLVHSALIA